MGNWITPSFAARHLAVVAALVLSMGAAQAASVSDYGEVAGGAQIVGSGSAVLSSDSIGINNVFGSASGGALGSLPTAVFPINLGLTVSGTSVTGGTLFSLSSVSPYLAANFLDAAASNGTMTFLMQVTPGTTAAAAFGSHVLVTLFNPGFGPDPFGLLPGIQAPATATYDQTSIRIAEAELLPAVPVPAGIVLMATALAGFAAVARKRGPAR